jgi:outer membrane immunogenic protein
MNRVALTIVGTAFVAGFGGQVMSADLPTAPPYQAPAMVPAAPPVYNWSGIYFGLNGGYTVGQATPMSLYSTNFTAFNYPANGWIGGLTAGAQIQSGHTVIGIEGDIDWANITGSSQGTIFNNSILVGNATLSSTVNSIGTLRTRIGYAADNWLIYGTGGLAITNEESTLSGATFVCGGANPPCSSITQLHLGLSAGAGVEYGITPNVSAKTEYIWVGAGALNTLKENMFRIGANWRFGM